jgi:hypothetical protein
MAMADENDKVPSYVEYVAADEEYWRAEKRAALFADFDLTEAQLSDWHFLMSNQGRAWEIIRRLYQVGLMLEPDEEVLKSWDTNKIGKAFGIPAAQVQQELDLAIRNWRLLRARADVRKQAEVTGAEEVDILRSMPHASMDEQYVNDLLKAFDFDDVSTDPMMRAQVAGRIISLKDFLASPHSRTSARQLIRMEVSLHSKEKILMLYNRKIEQIAKEDPELRSKKTELQGYQEAAKNLDAEIRAITKAHGVLQVDIGANDIDMTTRKRLYVETVGYLMEQCRIYESEPENILLDSVFTAAEIVWLSEPLDERPPQYRPDVVMRLNEAMRPENLWNPEYVPSPISQRACQILRKIVEGASAALKGVPEDAPALHEPDDDDDEGSFDGSTILASAADDGEVSAAGPGAPLPFSMGRQGGGGGGVIGVF